MKGGRGEEERGNVKICSVARKYVFSSIAHAHKQEVFFFLEGLNAEQVRVGAIFVHTSHKKLRERQKQEKVQREVRKTKETLMTHSSQY